MNSHRILRWAIIPLCGILAVTSVVSGPLVLPDTSRPGAVRPGGQNLAIESISDTVLEAIEIPEVFERPFDVDEGDSIVVKEFRLLDATDMPKFGISLDGLRALLNEQMARRPEGFTIGHLQQVADDVTTYYRSHGLILAQVVVPVQTVSSGTIDLQIFVGKLGDVLVEGNELYSDSILERAFQGFIGKPVSQTEIEAVLLTLTDYFGLSVFGVFQPGLHVGTADLVLKVQDEEYFNVSYRADTHGTRETGRSRLQTVVDWNNFMGFADRLSLSAQHSFNPKNNFFVSADYERFLVNGFKVGGFVNVNAFDVGGDVADSDISSKTESQSIFLEKSWLRSRQQNFSTRLGLFRKYSQTRTSGNAVSRNRLSVFSLSADFDSVDTLSFGDSNSGGGINFAYLELSRGLNNFLGAMGGHGDSTLLSPGSQPSRRGSVLGTERFSEGKFSKMFASYTRLQTIAKNHSLLLKTEYQWSKDLLTPLEQYSVGGANNVRAFPNAGVLWDRAYFLSLEWLLNAPFVADKPAFANRTWGELLQVSIFYDLARGKLNHPLDSEVRNYNVLKGAGLGLRFVVPGLFQSQFSVATEIGEEEVSNQRDFQFWGDMTYSF